MSKVTNFRKRGYYTYDAETQRSMTIFARFLVESGFQYGEVEDSPPEPDCHCLISVKSPECYHDAELSWGTDTSDPRALRRFIGALEEVKYRALRRLEEIDDGV